MIQANYRLIVLMVGAGFMIGTTLATPFTDKDTGRQVAIEGNSRGATGCVACHGVDGAGMAESGYPRLAGLPKAYLLGQLQAFRSGTRQSALMERIAKALNEQEMDLVSDYYADLEIPPAQPSNADVETLELGKRLVQQGKWGVGMPACVRCHGQDTQGVPPVFPRLAGQHASYLRQQLQHWQKGERQNDPSGLMQAVAKHLDDQEITAVAAYLASLAPAAPTAAGMERIDRASVAPHDQGFIDRVTAWLKESDDEFQQPEEDRIPDNEFGKLILLGKRVFVDTQRYASSYVGNGLNCVNCHLDRGRRVESAPMGAAYIQYPKYRAKNDQVNTIEERIQGCFRYSENGTPPPPLSDEMKGLVSYFYFLSTDLPSGKKLSVAGYPDIDKPPESPDPHRGARVFAENCAICHGANGDGTRLGGQYQFPPLWGEDSFNWGAGMHRINTAAAFIRGNMPLGHPEVLNLQQVWDVAAYINSHERPQDPRFNGDVQATRKQYHDHQCYYGKQPYSETLGRFAAR